MVDQEGKLEKAGEAVKLLKSERQDKILDILLVEKKITTIIKKERYKYGDVKNHVGQALAP